MGKCFSCKLNNLTVKKTKAGKYFVGCEGYPSCKTSGFFNEAIKSINILDKQCKNCSTNAGPVYLSRIVFANNSFLPLKLKSSIDLGLHICLLDCDK